jgi:hypothetical protein
MLLRRRTPPGTATCRSRGAQRPESYLGAHCERRHPLLSGILQPGRRRCDRRADRVNIPKAAITAASVAIERELASGRVFAMAADSDEALARAALEAAAPVLAEAVAKRILAHMDQSTRRRAVRNRRGLLAYRRHFATAARVAAGAFSTPEDLKRMAIEAIARGDFVMCRDRGQEGL